MTGPGKSTGEAVTAGRLLKPRAVAGHDHRPARGHALSPSSDLCPAEGPTAAGMSVQRQLNANTRCLALGSCLEMKSSRRHVTGNQPRKI